MVKQPRISSALKGVTSMSPLIFVSRNSNFWIIFPRNSCEIFRSEGTENKKYTGYYKLECPKMLVPLTDIVPTLWLPSGVNKAVKIVFHGVRTNG